MMLMSGLITIAQENRGTNITVTIPNVPGNDGKVIVSIFTKDTFMKAPPVQTQTSTITDGKATVTFSNIEPGEYGIISFHDKNDNGQIDMEATGMPTEAYGVSNNPPSYGPPQWNDAKFTVADKPINMELRY